MRREDLLNNMQSANLEEILFASVIDKAEITTVFQPIISLRSSEVYGYEALSRGPENSSMENPEILFNLSEKYGRIWELEYLCRWKALEKAKCLEEDKKIFLNVSPHIMHDIKFRQGFTREYLNKFKINPDKIIFEITERQAISNVPDFINTVQNYKSQNYQIAIDDVGAGFSGLNLISGVYPHFIKLDMNLIRNIDKDFVKQAMVKSMCEFGQLTNTYLIAEGIETEAELLKLIEMGVHYGQGYFIQKPSSKIQNISEQVQEIILQANKNKNRFIGSTIYELYIYKICKKLPTVNANLKVEQVDAIFKKDTAAPGYCVVEEEQLLGIVTKNEMYKFLSGQYGYSLYGKKPVREIANANFLSVDYKMTIDIVSKKAMARSAEQLYDLIVVTKDARYYGVVTVKDLLEKAIEIEVINAKNLNPLSELPGNRLIELQLEQSIKNPEDLNILYFDIDNFKAYNDVYGFENGDKIIKLLTKILKDIFSLNDFVGHIGGDDFVVITNRNPIKNLVDKIIYNFERELKDYYNNDDWEQGYLICKNRRGIEECFPLLSLSVVCLEIKNFDCIYKLAEKASKLKKKCKLLNGSNFISE